MRSLQGPLSAQANLLGTIPLGSTPHFHRLVAGQRLSCGPFYKLDAVVPIPTLGGHNLCPSQFQPQAFPRSNIDPTWHLSTERECMNWCGFHYGVSD